MKKASCYITTTILVLAFSQIAWAQPIADPTVYCNVFDVPIIPTNVPYLSSLQPLSTGIYFWIPDYHWVDTSEIRIPKPAEIEVTALGPPGCTITGTEIDSEVVIFNTECPNPMPGYEVCLALMVDEVNPPIRKTSYAYVKNGAKRIAKSFPYGYGPHAGDDMITFDAPRCEVTAFEVEKLDAKLCEAIRLLLTPPDIRATACCEEMLFPEGKDVPGYCGDVINDEDSDENGAFTSPNMPHHRIRTLGRR